MPRIAAEMAAVTVPSGMSLILAPASLIPCDQVVVARAVEDDRRDVVHRAAEDVCDGGDVVAHRPEKIDRPACARAYRDLPHVHVRHHGERTAVADRDHRHRAVAAARNDSATFERIESEVDELRPHADLVPGRELAASSDAPITIRPVIGRSVRTDFMAEKAASSAPAWLPAPSQRALPRAARSVARA